MKRRLLFFVLVTVISAFSACSLLDETGMVLEDENGIVFSSKIDDPGLLVGQVGQDYFWPGYEGSFMFPGVGYVYISRAADGKISGNIYVEGERYNDSWIPLIGFNFETDFAEVSGNGLDIIRHTHKGVKVTYLTTSASSVIPQANPDQGRLLDVEMTRQTSTADVYVGGEMDQTSDSDYEGRISMLVIDKNGGKYKLDLTSLMTVDKTGVFSQM